MLHPLIFPLFLFIISALATEAACIQNSACPMQLQENFIQNSLQAIEVTQQEKEFQTFLTTSLQQRKAALEDKNFQEVVAKLQAQTPLSEVQSKYQSENQSQPGDLYIFVSFSMGEKALLNLAIEAKIYGATLVLRGFKDNSYAQTVKALHKIIQETGQGFIVDPELFSLFSVTAISTYILSRPFQLHALELTYTPLHDRLQGHVSLQYALETFAKEGDLQNEARFLLEKIEKGSSK